MVRVDLIEIFLGVCACIFIFSHFDLLVKNLIAYAFFFLKEILFHALFREDTRNEAARQQY